MYIHPRLWHNWDWWLSFFVFATLALGLSVLYSATNGVNAELIKQMAGVGIGLAGWVICGLLDFSEFRNLYRFIYWFNILLLVAVLVIGVEVNSSKSWISLGPVMLQPAELSKLFLTLTLSKVLVEMEHLKSWWDLFIPAVHVAPTILLVLLQGDAGTAMVIMVIVIALVFAAGFPAKKLLLIGGTVTVLVVGLVYSHYKYDTQFPLLPYQWDRIHVFLYPESDPLDRGYQVIQSKTAISTGGLWGKGLNQGLHSKLGYLPFHHTDFIFAVVVEELGFLGGALLLTLFALICFRFAMVGSGAKDRYGALICVGVATLFAAHVLENVGMALGVTPVTGIPLPLVSYGPTALVANLIGIGLVQSVAVHRDHIPLGSE